MFLKPQAGEFMYSVSGRNLSVASRDDRNRSYLPKALLPGPGPDSFDIP